MIQEQECASWLAFPEVPGWVSFCPELKVSLQPGQAPALQLEALSALATGSLAQAVSFLSVKDQLPLVYRALPQVNAEGSVPAPAFTHELCWPVFSSKQSRPVSIRNARSVLWCERRRCHAWFALENSNNTLALRLTVGGVSAQQCLEAWLIVSRWIGRLFQIQFPTAWGPREIGAPRIVRTTRRQELEQRRLNESIRAVLLKAAQFERDKAPFRLSGRGHEARVSLCLRLAAIVRGLELPRVYISGYGPKHFYPQRVFCHAANVLKRQFGRPVLSFGCRSVYVA